MKVWHNKHPPEPFYGPEDYNGWGTVEEEQEAHELSIERWMQIHKSMTFGERLVHLFSDGGCFVKVKE